jgi:uncharacterized membrane protein
MLVPVIVEVIAGLIVVWVAIRAWQGRLPRNGAVGVRTPATMRSDAAFETANKAAAPLAVAGGVVLAVCGVLGAVFPRHLVGMFIFGGVGLFLILVILGAAIGVRASRSVLPDEAPCCSAWVAGPGLRAVRGAADAPG